VIALRGGRPFFMGLSREHEIPGETGASALPLILRVGVAMCFIGHGAFGIMTKQAWLPYFGVVGISEPSAWRLMPWVGTMDVTIGFLALVWPCRAVFAWAAIWTTWTALLRPFAGQGWSEFFERAGNYGLPLAILAVVGLRASWLARLPEHWPELTTKARHRLAWTLRISTAALLAGHASCAVILHKASLAHHYAAFWPHSASSVMVLVGYFEIGLALVVLAVPVPAVLIAVCCWKLATESLFLLSGAPAPAFEIIERGGSYMIPLALAVLMSRRRQHSTTAPVPSLAL
jgi:hypothetical protein